MGKIVSLWLGLGLICILFTVGVRSDTPANCTTQDITGRWILYESNRNLTSKLAACLTVGPVVRKIVVDLNYPNVAVDQFGNIGTWTVVYNQGFEVTVNQRTYFAFSKYKQNGTLVQSICDKTFPGWSHDVTLRHWSCFHGRKQTTIPIKEHSEPFSDNGFPWVSAEVINRKHNDMVEHINKMNTTWKAKVHDIFLEKTHEELLKMAGGSGSRVLHRPPPARITDEHKILTSQLPEKFDWRDVNGLNFVSPVRNQGSCGSCYAFSSMGMLEARLRVATNNTMKVTLSPQDIVSCSHLAQGCSGGFPYLIAGRYGKDYGSVDESCNPYVGKDGPCVREVCDRHYTADYNYVGDYYGGCNELLMQHALIHRGPLSVSFEVHDDFMHYSGGIYKYTGLVDYTPFYEVNHAVLLVGYGVDEATGTKYWIVKNSWGLSWGENGFFRIVRGTDECGIESIAVEATPIP